MDVDSRKIMIDSLNEECYKRIKNDILTGHLAWGDKLNIINLADQFGISRSPVVKAIDKLAMEGLVTILPNKGSFVVTPSRNDIEEVTEIRIMIETMACLHAFRKNKNELLRRLSENKFSEAEVASGISFDRFLLHDREFHYIIVESTGNGRLFEYYKTIRSQSELFRTQTFTTEHLDKALRSHADILAAFSADNPEEAALQMEKHLQIVSEDTFESMKGL
jgi:DNA-binding GntR family transcriptional regulator